MSRSTKAASSVPSSMGSCAASGPPPSAWIARWLACLPPGARVVDLAAGSGRHLRLAHSLGLNVLGVDRDAAALATARVAIDPGTRGIDADRAQSVDADSPDGDAAEEPEGLPGGDGGGDRFGGSVDVLILDLESGPWSLPANTFDAVVVANYLFRPRFALACGLLAPGGLLIYETFGLGNEAYGRPSNPSFLLCEGELFDRARAAGLVVLGYESGYIEAPKPAIVQRLCAARPPLDGERLCLG